MVDADTKVLIVEDSRSTAMALTRMLDCFNVVGVATHGAEAIRMEQELSPDVITIDIHLPDTDGLQLTRQILARRKVPIIIISSMVSPNKQKLVFEALRAGAYDVVPKSRYINVRASDRATWRLLMLIRTAAARSSAPQSSPTTQPPRTGGHPFRQPAPVRPRLVVLGASTGGPAALRWIFSALPSPFPAPVLVALHIARGFADGVVRWLDSESSLSVRLAQQGEWAVPGAAYLAPSGCHLALGNDGTFNLPPCKGSGPCPSVDTLFESVAETAGSQAVCLLLTGMGSDGAQGLLAAKRAGCVTAVQDHTTSVAFGMPGEALRLSATGTALALDAIAPWLTQQLGE